MQSSELIKHTAMMDQCSDGNRTLQCAIEHPAPGNTAREGLNALYLCQGAVEDWTLQHELPKT